MSGALHVDRRAAVADARSAQSLRSGADAHAVPDAPLPLVMLHGWGMNLRVFDALRDELADHETWAIDLPGYGHSPWWAGATSFEAQRDAVLAVLPARCVLVGWSFGAKLAMALAAAHPDRIAALVLLAATPRFAHAEDWPQGSDPRAAKAFHDLLDQDWQRTLSDFIWLQVRGSRDAEQTGQRLQAALAAHGEPRREALHAGLDLLDALDLRALVPAIAQPALLVAGVNDRVTLPAASRWLAEHLPRATLVEIARAGHAPFVSHHAEVASAMRAFLADLP